MDFCYGGVALRIAIVGAGLMGSAAAKYLVARREVKAVQLVDKDKTQLERTMKSANSKKLRPHLLDASDRTSISEAVKGFDAAVIALPHAASFSTDLAVIDAGVSAVDLVFEDAQMKLHPKCLKAGMTLIPGCGVAPGIVQVLAGEGARQLTSVEAIHMLVGGLPQVPRPPLNYRIVFSFEQVLEMYANEIVRVIRDGKVKKTTALTEVERVSFPEPYHDMEAFLTDGVATLLYTMKGRVKFVDEKTVRYPGHAKQIRTLIETGLVSTRPVKVDGAKITPRRFLSDVLGPKLLLGKEKDVTLLRVTVTGTKNDSDVKYEYEMVDYYDEVEQATSMARTTAYTGAIAAMMLGDGRISKKGILPPESAFVGSNFKTLFQRLAEKNVKISRTVTTRTPNIVRP
jgi:lysine 6-dehydrogenase